MPSNSPNWFRSLKFPFAIVQLRRILEEAIECIAHIHAAYTRSMYEDSLSKRVYMVYMVNIQRTCMEHIQSADLKRTQSAHPWHTIRANELKIDRREKMKNKRR